MKVGILVECGRQGLEDVLCARICELLKQHMNLKFEYDIVPMDNKQRLIQECGTVAAQLLGSNCNRVVILWDERPAWPKIGEQLCWHRDRADILANLARANMNNTRVHLVCIEREFESWLLYDERMLSRMFSTDAHSVQVPKQKKPHQIQNPKGTMMSLFKKHGGRRYVDVQYARSFAKHLEDLSRLGRCQTFRRFAERVTGRNLI